MLKREGPNLVHRITFAHAPVLGELNPRLADGSAGPVAALPNDGFLGPARRCLALGGPLECKVAGLPVAEYLTFVEREDRRIDPKRMEAGWLLFSDASIL